MTNQPTFTTPGEAMAFIRECLDQKDPSRLYAAFTHAPGDLWKDHLFQGLQEIQQAETLEGVFLDDAQITAFPEHETRLHLGGHGPRTHYIHIDLVSSSGGWVLESILVCR